MVWTLLIAGAIAAAMVGAGASCSSSGSGVASGDGGLDRSVADAGQPRLTALAVTSTTGVSTIELTPAFDPETFDYYVRCQAGSNGLEVALTAPAGTLGRVVQPTASPSLQTQTVLLTAGENDAIVATATRAGASTEYWVRCLPSDFPQLSWTRPAGRSAPPPGYYLVSTVVPIGYSMILDRNGVPVWYLAAPSSQSNMNFDNPAPGKVSFVQFSLSTYGMSGTYQVRDLAAKVSTKIAPSGQPTDIHELRLLPNGNYLVLSNPTTTGVDLTGLTQELPDGGQEALGPDSSITECALVEFTSSGQIAWTWKASDHFDAAKVTTLGSATGVGGGGVGGALDVFHCNSVDVDPANGNLLVSGFQMDSVFYVERSSGKVLWKMGGSSASRDDATYVTVDDAFHGQHDARLLAGWSADCQGGAGQISMFDDEPTGMKPARGVVYDVVVGGAGSGGAACDAGSGHPGSATLSWQSPGTSSTSAMGSFRILADGSRVIDWGFSSRTMSGPPGDGGFAVPGDGGFPFPGDGGFPFPGDGGFPLPGNGDGAATGADGGVQDVFTEVDPSGAPLVHFTFGTQNNYSYRTVKVPLSGFDLNLLRTTAGLP